MVARRSASARATISSRSVMTSRKTRCSSSVSLAWAVSHSAKRALSTLPSSAREPSFSMVTGRSSTTGRISGRVTEPTCTWTRVNPPARTFSSKSRIRPCCLPLRSSTEISRCFWKSSPEKSPGRIRASSREEPVHEVLQGGAVSRLQAQQTRLLGRGEVVDVQQVVRRRALVGQGPQVQLDGGHAAGADEAGDEDVEAERGNGKAELQGAHRPVLADDAPGRFEVSRGVGAQPLGGTAPSQP